jgi:hypothetical protein
LSRSRAKRKQRSPERSSHSTEEPRSGEALTVFWMLTLVATLAAEGIAAATALVALSRGAFDEERPSLLAVLPGVMFFTALATGGLCLLLTVLVPRVRREPPPRSIVWIAGIAGAAPYAYLLARAALRL